jgi:hypothetical protein
MTDVIIILIMSFTDEQVRAAVDSLWHKYEGEATGFVEGHQQRRLRHDLVLELQVKRHLPAEEAEALASELDSNRVGRITIDELYCLLRKLNS